MLQKENQAEEDPERQSSEAKDGAFVRATAKTEITKQVIRKKLWKQRHLVVEKAIDPAYLDSIFPKIVDLFKPQTVHYNGGIAKVPEWKISCYLEVMPGGVPTTEPNLQLLQVLNPLLEQCNDLFLHWYKQQHACNKPCRLRQPNNVDTSTRLASDPVAHSPSHAPTTTGNSRILTCHRLMTFITRYTPAPGEQALLKHVDGAGKVDGSVVVALPMEANQQFEGGGLTVWDGKTSSATGSGLLETHYDTRSGDVAFIDRAVWHQADPITKGTRWALVIFYKVNIQEYF